MIPRFQVDTKQDKDAYRNMVTVEFILYHKTPTPVFYGISVFFAAFLWWGAVFASGNPVKPVAAVLYGVVLLALAILGAPYFDHFAVKRVSARILRTTLKNAKDLGAPLSLDFGDEGLILKSATAHAERSYASLTALCETATHILLFQGKDYCFNFAKKDMTEGTPEELKAFLEEKCGKPFRRFEW